MRQNLPSHLKYWVSVRILLHTTKLVLISCFKEFITLVKKHTVCYWKLFIPDTSPRISRLVLFGLGEGTTTLFQLASYIDGLTYDNLYLNTSPSLNGLLEYFLSPSVKLVTLLVTIALTWLTSRLRLRVLNSGPNSKWRDESNASGRVVRCWCIQGSVGNTSGDDWAQRMKKVCFVQVLINPAR
jgi:hypothetical protein